MDLLLSSAMTTSPETASFDASSRLRVSSSGSPVNSNSPQRKALLSVAEQAEQARAALGVDTSWLREQVSRGGHSDTKLLLVVPLDSEPEEALLKTGNGRSSSGGGSQGLSQAVSRKQRRRMSINRSTITGVHPLGSYLVLTHHRPSAESEILSIMTTSSSAVGVADGLEVIFRRTLRVLNGFRRLPTDNGSTSTHTSKGHNGTTRTNASSTTELVRSGNAGGNGSGSGSGRGSGSGSGRGSGSGSTRAEVELSFEPHDLRVVSLCLESEAAVDDFLRVLGRALQLFGREGVAGGVLLCGSGSGSGSGSSSSGDGGRGRNKGALISYSPPPAKRAEIALTLTPTPHDANDAAFQSQTRDSDMEVHPALLLQFPLLRSALSLRATQGLGLLADDPDLGALATSDAGLASANAAAAAAAAAAASAASAAVSAASNSISAPMLLPVANADEVTNLHPSLSPNTTTALWALKNVHVEPRFLSPTMSLTLFIFLNSSRACLSSMPRVLFIAHI
jgi:hypothetical protein